MLQLVSTAALYVTDSLFSSWDNQFYPNIAARSLMLRSTPTRPAASADPDFFVDFGKNPKFAAPRDPFSRGTRRRSVDVSWPRDAAAFVGVPALAGEDRLKPGLQQ